MDNEEVIKQIKEITERELSAWKKARGYAPDEVSDKIEHIMMDWIISLTECLDIWGKKAADLTDGELILARTNLGALVEDWLKLFLVIHLEDYNNNPILDCKGKFIKPEKLSFEKLRIYFKSHILNLSPGQKFINWIESIQHRRNAIHAFNYKDIGTVYDLENDFVIYRDFIRYLIDVMPGNPNEFDW
ncbi:hypothetical protein [Sporolactobacillus pectinivorans]|uniref:hypothetical protein n=1 Tax=Sporolactobacillus pectinivorans TaxID=1591408 RepID=UPI000C266E2C|nr:hypothetical protein [Sporolactobacillus pectinivorans]